MNCTNEERKFYEDHLKWLKIEANTLKKVEDRSRAEDRAEGEQNKAIEVARRMLDKKTRY